MHPPFVNFFMIEFWLTHNDTDIFRQTLAPGSYQLGRASSSDLRVVSPHISRNHLQIDVAAGGLQLTDLGSTNGLRLNGQQMPAGQPFTITASDRVEIGPLRLHFQPQSQPSQPSTSQFQPPAGASLPESNAGIVIHCPQATPKKYDLRVGTVSVGAAPSNGLRLSLPGIAPQHALIRLSHRQVEVVRLSAEFLVSKNGVELPVGEAVVWGRNESLVMGPAGLVYAPQQSRGRHLRRREGRFGWLWTMGGLGAFVLLLACLTIAVIVAYNWWGSGDDGPNQPPRD